MRLPMNLAWLVGNSVGALTIPWLTARETAALIVVVVSLLFFRSFRERYLLTWGLGWIAYGVFLWSARASELPGASKAMAAFAQADFVLAVGLFAAAALMSTHARRLLTALAVGSGVLAVYAGLRPLYFGNSPALGIGLEVACRLIAVGTALELMRYRRGRMGFGPWLFSAGLLTLNLNWPPFTHHILNEGYLLAEALFGASILVLGLDDSRLRTRRLEVLNELTVTISRAQNHGPMMQAALEKLKAVTGAKAAWFSLMEAGQLTPTQQEGLSSDSLRVIALAGMDETLARVFETNQAAVLKPSEVPEEIRTQIKKQGMGHLVLLPVQGKKSVIGMLALGCSGSPRHSLEELEFLETAAQRLGIAVENLRLLEQVLRSQRQWMNTFDSIQDLILAHDADFHILKTNQALLQRLGRAPADVLGNLCDAVLPHQQAWSGCPYCECGPGASEGQDPCFGGVSVVSTSSYAEQGSQQRGTIHVVRDTTEHHAAEEKYRMLFEQAQEGVFVARLDGKLLDCNDAFVTML
ncbi:MAG TPA: PAS domain-containing protein, partial [Terriglobales bacterium]